MRAPIHPRLEAINALPANNPQLLSIPTGVITAAAHQAYARTPNINPITSNINFHLWADTDHPGSISFPAKDHRWRRRVGDFPTPTTFRPGFPSSFLAKELYRWVFKYHLLDEGFSDTTALGEMRAIALDFTTELAGFDPEPIMLSVLAVRKWALDGGDFDWDELVAMPSYDTVVAALAAPGFPVAALAHGVESWDEWPADPDFPRYFAEFVRGIDLLGNTNFPLLTHAVLGIDAAALHEHLTSRPALAPEYSGADFLAATALEFLPHLAPGSTIGDSIGDIDGPLTRLAAALKQQPHPADVRLVGWALEPTTACLVDLYCYLMGFDITVLDTTPVQATPVQATPAQATPAQATQVPAMPAPAMQAELILAETAGHTAGGPYNPARAQALGMDSLPDGTVWAEIAHTYRALKPGGTALILIPAECDRHKIGEQVRQHLVERGALPAIIALGNTIYCASSSDPHLWVLRKPTPQETPLPQVTVIDAREERNSYCSIPQWLRSVRQGAPLTVPQRNITANALRDLDGVIDPAVLFEHRQHDSGVAAHMALHAGAIHVQDFRNHIDDVLRAVRLDGTITPTTVKNASNEARTAESGDADDESMAQGSATPPVHAATTSASAPRVVGGTRQPGAYLPHCSQFAAAAHTQPGARHRHGAEPEPR